MGKENEISVAQESIIQEYPVLQNLQSIESLDTGGLNSSFIVSTDRSKYFLRLYKMPANPNTVRYEAPLMVKMRRMGISTPRVYPNLEGELTGSVNNTPVLLTEYIQGDFYPREGDRLTDTQIYEAATQLGRIHRLSTNGFIIVEGIPSDVETYTTTSFFDAQKAISLWQYSLDIINNKTKKDSIDQTIEHISDSKIHELLQLDSNLINANALNLPSVLSHGDFLPQNIIYRDGKIVGVVDWELSRFQPKIWEFARALCGFCRSDSTELFNTPIDWRKARVFSQAYSIEETLSEEEKNVCGELLYIASLFPLYLLESRYIYNNSRANKLVPQNETYWNFWKNNAKNLRRNIFD